MEKHRMTLSLLLLIGLQCFVQGAKIDMSKCDTTKNCWKKPSSCTDESDCTGIVTWMKSGDNINFEIFGKKRWISVGFSTDEAMGDDSIHVCLAPETGSAVIKTLKSTGESLPPEVSPAYTEITNKQLNYENGTFICSFTRPITTDHPQVYNLTDKYMLFWAEGDLVGTTLQAHIKAERGHSEGKIDFRQNPGTGPISLSSCGSSKSCWKKPSSCSSEANCQGIITWKKNGDFMTFEMMGKDKYVALGFSSDDDMGDDSIHGCLSTTSGTMMKTYKSTGESLPPEKTYSKLTNINMETDNSILRCRFTRPIQSGSSDVFNLNTNYYLFWAEGGLTGTTMNKHTKTGHSEDKINFEAPPSSKADNVNANIALLTSLICLIITILMN